MDRLQQPKELEKLAVDLTTVEMNVKQLQDEMRRLKNHATHISDLEQSAEKFHAEAMKRQQEMAQTLHKLRNFEQNVLPKIKEVTEGITP